jgi:hypothetical protein
VVPLLWNGGFEVGWLCGIRATNDCYRGRLRVFK